MTAALSYRRYRVLLGREPCGDFLKLQQVCLVSCQAATKLLLFSWLHVSSQTSLTMIVHARKPNFAAMPTPNLKMIAIADGCHLHMT